MISRPMLFEQFAGRSDEAAHLLERRRAAGNNRGGLVLIGGEAGIGKSRLVSEFLAPLVRGTTRVARVECREFAQSAFAPIDDALGQLQASRGARTFADVDARVRDALESLEAIAERRTTVLAIEDLHWADPELLALLVRIVARAAHQRLLIVATYRDDEIVPGHANYTTLARLVREPATTVVTLRALPAGSIESLVRATVESRGIDASGIVAEVAARSEGNPFFGEELLRHAVDRMAAPRGYSAGLPISLRGVVQERIERCSPAARDVLTAAAVCGRRFERGLLSSIVGESAERIDERLRELTGLQLLAAVDELRGLYEFRHALTRDALYADVDPEAARPLHRRIAESLERAPDAEARALEIAFHRWHEGDHASAAASYEAAARAARRELAFVDAIRWNERALEAYAGRPDDEARVMLALGTVLVAAGDAERAYAIYERAASEARARGDASIVVRARKLMAGQYANDGRREAAIALLEATLRESGASLDSGERAGLQLRIANYRALEQDPAPARAALASVDPAAVAGTTQLRAEYFAARSLLDAKEGDEAGWQRNFALSLDTFEALSARMFVRFTHSNFAWQAWSLGRLDLARRHVLLARDASPESAGPSNDVPLTMALIAVSAGDLRDARAWLDRSLALPDMMSRKLRAASGVELGVALGDEALVREHLDLRLLDEAEAIADAYGSVHLAVAFALGLESLGRGAEAERLYARASAAIRSTYQFVPALVTLAQRAPSAAPLARERLAGSPSLARSSFLRSALALVEAEIAYREGDAALARTRAEPAHAGFLELGWNGLAARAAELGGDTKRALALYRDCGYVAELRRLGLTTTVAVDRAEGVLTAREHEVALHVAEGSSNREAAKAMSVSEKTIEKHLAAVYAKLALTSRAQLRERFAKADE